MRRPRSTRASSPSGRRWLEVLGILCSLSLLASCVSSGKYKAAVDEQQNLVSELDTLAQQRDELAKERDALARETESLGKERDALAAEKAELARETDDLALDKAALERRAADLEEERQKLDAELDARSMELSDIQRTYDGLVKELKGELAAGQVTIERLRDGVKVNLSQDILFETGSAELDDAGRAVLLKVSEQLKDSPHQIMITGHTDNVKIRGKLAQQYPTNWELGGARAASVVRLFEEAGIDSKRLLAISYGEHHPVASNDTPEGRAKNRRIEIRLKPVESEG